MTWPKMLALCLVLVACTEQLVEAITGRGDPTSNRARRKPTKPAPQLTERQRLAETLRDLAAHSEQRATITTTVGAPT